MFTGSFLSGDSKIVTVVDGSILSVAVPPPPPMPTEYHFDFGTANSPLATGYTRVSAANVYTSQQGWGWTGGDYKEHDRAIGSALQRDFIFGSDYSFRADLENGNYKVTLMIGDTGDDHELVGVFLQGSQVDTITHASGQVFTKVYRNVSVVNNNLIVRIKDMGGTDPNGMLVAMDVVPDDDEPDPEPQPEPVEEYGTQIPMSQVTCASWRVEPACELLKSLFAQGKAAGYGAGFGYHNDDGHHAALEKNEIPAIHFYPHTGGWSSNSYNGLHANAYFQPYPDSPVSDLSHPWTIGDHNTNHPSKHLGRCVLGNASHASMVHIILNQGFPDWNTSPKLHWEYSKHNFRYFYPAHDVLWGADNFKCLAPWVTFSIGSSNSELGLMMGFFKGAAALRPNVQAKLIADGRLWSVVHQIFCMARVGVISSSYLTGSAHVVASGYVDEVAIVNYANSISMAKIPPSTRISIVSETFNDATLYNLLEKIFETPTCISRYHSDSANTKEIILQGHAEDIVETTPITHKWVLLNGDPSKVQIIPQDSNGSKVKIITEYPTPWNGVNGVNKRLDFAYICWTDPEFPSAPSYFSIYGNRT